MIRRHPHVFGDVHVEHAEEVVRNWQAIKQEEKQGSLFHCLTMWLRRYQAHREHMNIKKGSGSWI